jgi:hypothetical protein
MKNYLLEFLKEKKGPTYTTIKLTLFMLIPDSLYLAVVLFFCCCRIVIAAVAAIGIEYGEGCSQVVPGSRKILLTHTKSAKFSTKTNKSPSHY